MSAECKHHSFLQKGKKEVSGNYRPVSLPGKVTEQLILQAICKQVKNKKVIASREHRLKNGKPCLTNPIMLYDETTSLRGELWILSTLTSVWLSTLPPIRLS